MRERVQALEAAMLDLPQAECPVSHHFAPGQYARKMEIAAGTVVTGAIHKTEHLIVIAKGRLRIVTDDGTTEVQAGDIITCKPGMKNAVVALEDSAWVNFFPTNETDPAKLVEVLTESTASELLGGSQNKQLANLKGQTWHLE
jgi:quercetin dioxygenase-like cupin family protein